MLPAPHRLKGKKIFNDLFRSGKNFSTNILLMKTGSGEDNKPTKFGFGVSLKFSKKAVERNKIKRWMREAVQANLKNVKMGKNVVFFIKPRVPKSELSLEIIEKNIKILLKQAKII